MSIGAAPLHDDLVAALADVADQVAEHQPGTKPGPGDWLDVRSGTVAAALRCAAAAALDGEGDFEPSAATAGWKATADVTDLLVHGHHDPRRGAPPADPASAFRQLWADRGRLDTWPWPWLGDEAQPADRALTAAEVHRRAAGLARMLQPWPPSDAGAVGHRATWTFPRRALRLHGRAELVLGRRGRGHTLVVVLHGDHGPATRTRLAYEAVVETAALRAAPATVLGLLPDAGRRWELQVDDALLAQGVTAAATAAATALAARTREPGDLPRTPGAACRRCSHQPDCLPGLTWLAGPGRLRSGFLPLP
jgi:hypothetical protein